MIIQGSPDILEGPQGLGAVPTGRPTGLEAGMFLNSMHGACPPGTILPTEADWIDFSAMVHFAPGTDMEKEKNNFLTSCRNQEGTVYETEFFPDETGVYRPRQTTGSINPALILAAAAAYFFAG